MKYQEVEMSKQSVNFEGLLKNHSSGIKHEFIGMRNDQIMPVEGGHLIV